MVFRGQLVSRGLVICQIIRDWKVIKKWEVNK